jgi:adenylate cyclase
MGAESRFNYSAVGDAVNIAARIESACKSVSFDILVSDRTASTLSDYALLYAGALELKGKSGRTNVYAVVGDDHVGRAPEFKELLKFHEELLRSLQYHRADEPAVSDPEVLEKIARWPALQEFYAAVLKRRDHFAAKSAMAIGRSDIAPTARPAESPLATSTVLGVP